MCKHWAVRRSSISVWYIITLLLFAGICHSAETWTGAGSDQNWSTGVNWSGGVPPIGTDVVTFSAAGPGSNIVDTNFTISGLQYIGNGAHATSLIGTSQLQINGPVTLGPGNSSLTLGSNSTLVVGTPAARADLTIGLNNAGGTATGLLDARQGTIDLHLTNLNVGYASGIGTGWAPCGGTAPLSLTPLTSTSAGAGARVSWMCRLAAPSCWARQPIPSRPWASATTIATEAGPAPHTWTLPSPTPPLQRTSAATWPSATRPGRSITPVAMPTAASPSAVTPRWSWARLLPGPTSPSASTTPGAPPQACSMPARAPLTCTSPT